MSRYDITGWQNTEEEGSSGQVLKNRLGLKTRVDINRAELMLLRKLYLAVLQDLPQSQITVKMIRQWHRRWLGNIYTWAGHERSVNMSKDGFPFAAADRIPHLLKIFEHDYLLRLTPCYGMDRHSLVRAIAMTHVEFILIHPFREGNGRIARLLADVMAVQAGFGPLDYSAWESDRKGYIQAIQKGMSRDYTPMCICIEQVLGSGSIRRGQIQG